MSCIHLHGKTATAIMNVTSIAKAAAVCDKHISMQGQYSKPLFLKYNHHYYLVLILLAPETGARPLTWTVLTMLVIQIHNFHVGGVWPSAPSLCREIIWTANIFVRFNKFPQKEFHASTVYHPIWWLVDQPSILSIHLVWHINLSLSSIL